MDCEKARAYLTEYIDGFLPEAERAELEAHIEVCVECKKEVEALRVLRGELRALKLEDTSDFVFDHKKAKASVVLPLYKQRWVRALSVAAACFVLFIGVLTVTQNGYQTPQDSEVQSLENEAEDDARVQTDKATNGEVEIEGGPRAKTAELPYADTGLTVPDTYGYYSSTLPSPVQRDVEENEKQSTPDASEEPQTRTPEAETAVTVQAEAVPVPSVPAADGTLDAADSEAQTPASGGGGANPMPTYYKRIVRLSVSAEAQERFLQVISGLLCDDSFLDTTVISEGDLPQLLSIEGVSLVSESTVETQAAYYRGKVIVIY